MIVGVIDTTVLIHLFRNNGAAIAWIATQQNLAITLISWLEFIQGAPGKSGQARCLQLMQQFNLELLTPSDHQWAMQQMVGYRLSHGVKYGDCLIAAVSHRLQVPLYIANVKDFIPILGTGLVVKPY